ncbi:MAG: transporter [Proteobacteria bacterium]|nr:transporter [Pseudomonadota bacterium]
MKHVLTGAVALMLGAATPAFADDIHSESYNTFLARPDGHAPIGVMADHMHGKGDFMLSYRYMRMEMDGLRAGTHTQTPQQVLGSYMMTPLDMHTNMHMFGGMYGLTDKVTVMAMVPYLDKKMETLHRNGTRAKQTADGLGDIKASALMELWEGDNARLQGQLGLSLPTGDIDKTGTTGARLAYPMQLGSGTYDAIASLTYSGHTADWSWGAQGATTLRTGDNDNGYRLGNIYSATGWLARPVTENVSLSGRLLGTYTGQINGRDSALTPMMMPAANTINSGGTMVDAGFGVNFLMPATAKGHRLSLEVTVPMYRNLQGTQLEKDYAVTLGWQKTF